MRFVWILLAGMLLGGCAWFRSGSSKTSGAQPPGGANTSAANGKKLIVTPDTVKTGKVVQVNEREKFAILNFPVGGLPPLEQLLNVYRSGLKVGEIRISGPQSEDNTVGDIIQGEAKVGDEVRSN